jgi:hypothetical protein
MKLSAKEKNALHKRARAMYRTYLFQILADPNPNLDREFSVRYLCECFNINCASRERKALKQKGDA